MTATSPLSVYRNVPGGAAVEAGEDRIGRPSLPDWMAPCATPGTGRSFFHGCTAASPSAMISGWPGTVRSGWTRIRPARSVSAPGRLGDAPHERRGLDARGPERGPGGDGLLDAVVDDGDRVRVHVDHAGPGADLHAQLARAGCAADAERSGG